MATVRCFEDLICWQKARELARFIYQITNAVDFSRDFGLRDQIRRAAVSVMSNIAEGFDRGTRIELINFFFIAKVPAEKLKANYTLPKMSDILMCQNLDTEPACAMKFRA